MLPIICIPFLEDLLILGSPYFQLILDGLLYYFQDVVEERFRTEYLIAIVVAVMLLLIISLVVTTLLAMWLG